MRCINLHSATIQVQRKGQPVTVNVEADVDGEIVSINKVTVDGAPFILDDNEWNAARCVILDKIYPKQGWDMRAKRLFSIALKFPGV